MGSTAIAILVLVLVLVAVGVVGLIWVRNRRDSAPVVVAVVANHGKTGAVVSALATAGITGEVVSGDDGAGVAITVPRRLEAEARKVLAGYARG